MPFALQLQESLWNRENHVAREFAAGDSLGDVLSRHLIAVETAAETDLLTSILLLEGGMRLRHAAAPSLPRSYCEAIDGGEIGPEAGSCGTAAYLGHAVYVSDIATDDLWKDYRDVALEHGLRSCWSTPILDVDGAILGTFAIYHLTPRSPTLDEVEAIRLITRHVAQAIMRSRLPVGGSHGEWNDQSESAGPHLVIGNDGQESDWRADPGSEMRFEAYADKLDRLAEMVTTPKLAEALKAVAADCRNLVRNVRGDCDPPCDGR